MAYPTGVFLTLVPGMRLQDPIAMDGYILLEMVRVEFDSTSVDMRTFAAGQVAFVGTLHNYKYQCRNVAAFQARKTSDDSIVTVAAGTNMEMPTNFTALNATAFGYADPAKIGD